MEKKLSDIYIKALNDAINLILAKDKEIEKLKEFEVNAKDEGTKALQMFIDDIYYSLGMKGGDLIGEIEKLKDFVKLIDEIKNHVPLGAIIMSELNSLID